MPTIQAKDRRGEGFGLFAIIESKRVILPLKGVECEFAVLSGMAEFCMTQVFRQENQRAIDCEYLFPLPADACVYACEADINGRVIRAQVREREEARRLAAEKKAAGFRTALVESERENLFTLSLGNVQPGDLVIVRLRYFQTLRALARTRAVEIPFCPGVRYIPGNPLLRGNQGKGVVDDTDQVPDASRITPVRIDADHPDAAYVAVRGRWDARFIDDKSLVSPSHKIDVKRDGEDLCVALSDLAEVPDRDLVVRWTEKDADSVASRMWTCQKEDQTYALMEIRAPQTVSTNRPPVDFYFLVDRSGSMNGAKWNKAVEALQNCMKVLGAQDRAMVTLFESSFRDFAAEPAAPGKLLEDSHFQALKELGTGGGTEMEPALRHVLKVATHHSKGRDKNLILITDAQIGNESEILELMKAVPDLAVHAFGIDVALNDALLLALCRQQGGTFHSMNPNDDIQAAVTALGKTLGQPVLLDLALPSGWEPANAKLPNLYAGQIHYLSVRSKNGEALELSARTPESGPVRIQLENQPVKVQAPYLCWCRSRIDQCVAAGENKQAIDLSIRSNLICPLTAFVAWDESEKVTVASHHLAQPSQELAGSLEHALFCRMPTLNDTLVGFRRRARSGQENHLSVSRALSAPELHEGINLQLELVRLCLRIGVPDYDNMLTVVHDWLGRAPKNARAKALRALLQLVKRIGALAQQIDVWKRVATDQKLLQRTPVEDIEKRIEEATTAAQELLRDFVEKYCANQK